MNTDRLIDLVVLYGMLSEALRNAQLLSEDAAAADINARMGKLSARIDALTDRPAPPLVCGA